MVMLYRLIFKMRLILIIIIAFILTIFSTPLSLSIRISLPYPWILISEPNQITQNSILACPAILRVSFLGGPLRYLLGSNSYQEVQDLAEKFVGTNLTVYRFPLFKTDYCGDYLLFNPVTFLTDFFLFFILCSIALLIWKKEIAWVLHIGA